MREPVAANCRRGCLVAVRRWQEGGRDCPRQRLGGIRKGSLGVEQEEDILGILEGNLEVGGEGNRAAVMV